MALRSLTSLALVLSLAACSSASDEGAAKPKPVNCDLPNDAHAAERASCSFSAGAATKDTVGCEMQGKRLPFEHVVLIMQENRSFDHYLQKLPEFGQADVAVAQENTSLLAADGSSVSYHHKTDYCFNDTNHEWKGSHQEWNGGKNDGFAIANADAPKDPTGSRAVGYYDSTDIPFYYQLANTFSISDSYFCSVMGPTWPNRMYFYAASSFGNTANVPVGDDVPTLMNALKVAGISWKEYRSNYAPTAIFFQNALENHDRIVDISEFESDVKDGTLPAVSWVDATFDAGGAEEQSEHPPSDMQVGQKWMYDHVKMVMDSAYWKNTVVFITYDEHGGLYDHVAPPKACKPDDLPPKSPSDAAIGGFDQLGFRVPVFVVSPYTKSHYVSHVTHDHTSIVRFVETLFGLPALSRRDANADAMLDFFDFVDPPFLTPPALDEPAVDQTKLAQCLTEFPP